MSENLGEIYVKIKADVSNLAKEMDEIRRKVSKDGDEMGKKLSFKAKFDNSIALWRISELQKLREKLQKEFDKKVSIDVSSSSLDRTREKIAAVDARLKGVGETSQSLGSKIATAFASLGIVTGLFRLAKDSIQAFFESAKAERGVEQAVKRTGAAAGYTAGQLKIMAAELQTLTGIKDDKILSGVTKQLLTFTNIAGESFKRAQEAVLDLNAVISEGNVGSLTSEAIRLGEALENPIAGMGALTRAGVTFTEEQKKSITAFMRQNDLVSAQGVILTEIEKKYGGQAKAMADATQGTKQLSAAWNDMQEQIGYFLTNLPGLTWLIKNFAGGLETLGKIFEGNAYYVRMFKAELAGLKSQQIDITINYLQKNPQVDKKSLIDYSNTVIEANKKEWQELQKKIDLEKESVRGSDTVIKQLQKKQTLLSMSSALARADIEAVGKYNEKVAKSVDLINDKYNLVGKTSGQISDRLKELSDIQIDLDPKSDAGVKVQKEIDRINDWTKKNPVKVTTTFETKIPIIKETGESYTAKQVAEYEALKFAVKGYADYALAVIEMKYQQELADAKGNTQEILKAEEDKTLGIAKLNQEILDDEKKKNEKALEDAKKIGDKILEETQRNNEKLNEESDKSIKDRQDALNKYYDALSFKDEGYLAYRIENIKKEAKIIEEATNNKLLGEQFLISETQKLWQEYSDWRIEQWQKDNKVAAAALDSMKEGFTQAFQLIKIRTKQNASALENIFVDMANSFIAQVERMIAEWAAFQLLKGIVGIIAAPFTGGASAVAAVAAHSGGEFLGTSSGIKKMAAGGSMIIPPGYPNDSYPMLLESGEKISVTPAGSVGSQDRLLSEISNRLKTLEVLNKNLISKNFAPVIVANLELDGRKITKSVVSNINRMQKEGRNLSY